ncbi:MAG: hypothetical protein JZU60_02785 [Ilumatobacteraceae bacterium]|nr:hypothetical protein [Ilumatobacteraceae bacterium]
MTIKTWEDRLKNSTKIITSYDIRFAMQVEIDELREENADLESDLDTCMLHNVELQKELAALKNQEPVGVVNGGGHLWTFEGQSFKDGDKMFLAAGAQPEEVKHLEAQVDELQALAMVQKEYREPDDVLFGKIELAAHASYRRYESSCRGQQVTRSDSYESHLVWAAMSAAGAQPTPDGFTVTPLEEQQMFDDWCPYKGNPDPRVVWSAAVDAVNAMLEAAKGTP